MSKAYPEFVQEALAGIDEKRGKVVALIPASLTAQRIVQDFEHLEPSVRLSTWSTPEIVVAIKPKAMSELAEILRVFAKRGYRLKSDGIRNHDFCQEMNYELQGGIKIEAKFARQDGEEVPAQCRYVKVGEKKEVKEIITPIYELQCD